MFKQMIAALAIGALAAPLAAEPPKKDKRWEQRDEHPNRGGYGHGHRDRDRDWDRGRHYREGRHDRGGRRAYGIPPGHLPPPGACRVWFDDRPPGHQPPPTSCRAAERQAWRYGGRVIYGG